MKNCIYLLNFLVFSVNATTLEEQYPNFFNCKADTYIDRVNGTVHGNYFLERNLLPCKQDNSVAEFCIKDNFHGLPVTKVMIPNSFPVLAFYIDLPLNKVKKILKNKLNFDVKEMNIYTEPTIISDGENKSILMCDSEEQ
jgi:hypothetical protein